MKKLIFLLIVISFSVSMQISAQGKRGKFNKEEFIKERNIFLTERIGLTAEEAAIFLPLENELLMKKFEVGRDCRKLQRHLHDKKEKTEEECKQLLECREKEKEMRDRLDKEYLEKFKEVLSAEKILQYQKAEREFFEEKMKK